MSPGLNSLYSLRLWLPFEPCAVSSHARNLASLHCLVDPDPAVCSSHMNFRGLTSDGSADVSLVLFALSHISNQRPASVELVDVFPSPDLIVSKSLVVLKAFANIFQHQQHCRCTVGTIGLSHICLDASRYCCIQILNLGLLFRCTKCVGYV
jgi:hypothetical protein